MGAGSQKLQGDSIVARVRLFGRVVLPHLTALARRPIRQIRLHVFSSLFRTSQHVPHGPFVGCTAIPQRIVPPSLTHGMGRVASAACQAPHHHVHPLLAPSGGAGFVRPPGPWRPLLGKQGRFPTSCRSGRCLLRSMRAPPPSKSVASICSSCSPGSSGDCHRRTVET